MSVNTDNLSQSDLKKIGENSTSVSDGQPTDLKGLPTNLDIVQYSKVLTRTTGIIQGKTKLGEDLKRLRDGIQIGALYMRDIALAKMPIWISTVLQPPPERTPVLAWLSSGDITIASFSSGAWEGDINEDEAILFWMAMPPDPNLNPVK